MVNNDLIDSFEDKDLRYINQLIISVAHNSLANLLLEFTVYSKWPRKWPKSIIIRFAQFQFPLRLANHVTLLNLKPSIFTHKIINHFTQNCNANNDISNYINSKQKTIKMSKIIQNLLLKLKLFLLNNL